MTPQAAFDTIPLGAIVIFGPCARPSPDALHYEQWRAEAAAGQLVKRTAPSRIGKFDAPGILSLHACTIDTLTGPGPRTVTPRTITCDARLHIDVVSVPKPGDVLVVRAGRGFQHMLHLAATRDEALDWARAHAFTDFELHQVQPDRSMVALPHYPQRLAA